MKIVEENQLEALQWCVNQISIHMDGDEGTSHLEASNVNSGFMTPNMYLQATGGRVKDNYLSETYPATTDLPPGKYSTVANFTDNPPGVNDGDICQIEVTEENDERKEIMFLHSYPSARWFKTVYGLNVKAPNDWARLERAVPLWSGSAQATGTDINLSDSLGKFERLRITFECAGVHINEVPTNSTYHTTCGVSAVNLYDNNNGTTQIMECRLNNTGGSKLTISLNTATTIYDGSTAVSEDPITIQKIEGIL